MYKARAPLGGFQAYVTRVVQPVLPHAGLERRKGPVLDIRGRDTTGTSRRLSQVRYNMCSRDSDLGVLVARLWMHNHSTTGTHDGTWGRENRDF